MTERRRVGILGGTFDPPHAGHLAVASMARAAMRLDEVILLPSGAPPHKQAAGTPEERLEMTRVLAGGRGLAVSDIELRRAGPTYTVDTLEALHAREDAYYVFIIGADNLLEVRRWRDFGRLARLCSFAVAGRPGVGRGAVGEEALRLRRAFGAEIEFLPQDGPDLSSARLRAMVEHGEPLGDLVPEDIAAYIARRGLYRQPWAEDAVEAYLARGLTPKRLRHSLAVRDTAVTLAKRYGVDAVKAARAGLAHDIAKNYPPERLLSEATRLGLPVHPVERQSPGLLHGRVGAELAREVFAWRDEEILEAIRWHVTGTPDNSDLSIVVNLADIIEPGRGFPAVDKVREAAHESLYGGMACAFARVITFLMWDQRVPVHPISIAFYNEMLLREKARRAPAGILKKTDADTETASKAEAGLEAGRDAGAGAGLGSKRDTGIKSKTDTSMEGTE